MNHSVRYLYSRLRNFKLPSVASSPDRDAEGSFHTVEVGGRVISRRPVSPESRLGSSRSPPLKKVPPGDRRDSLSGSRPGVLSFSRNPTRFLKDFRNPYTVLQTPRGSTSPDPVKTSDPRSLSPTPDQNRKVSQNTFNR